MMPYVLSHAVRSLLREKWINLLSILTIAAGLMVLGIGLFVVYNLDAATGRLPEQFSMILYLEDNLPKDRIDQTIAAVSRNSAVNSVRFISKEQALNELREMLKKSSYLVEGLEDNPLPDAIEIKLKKESVGQETARKVAGDMMKIQGVKEVDYGEKFLATLQYVKAGMKSIGLALAVMLAAGIIFVCYSTVKILFYRRNEEIETLKLLGATRWFIRAPFLIEGAAIGAAGGLISLIGILGFHYLVIVRLALAIPVFKAVLFPMTLLLPLPLGGLFLGLTGAAVALGRLRY